MENFFVCFGDCFFSFSFSFSVSFLFFFFFAINIRGDSTYHWQGVLQVFICFTNLSFRTP